MISKLLYRFLGFRVREGLKAFVGFYFIKKFVKGGVFFWVIVGKVRR